MAIKKSELYSTIWKLCDGLRGGMDASQYKDYVLVLLFVKYVSDKYAGKKDALIVIPEGGSFKDMIELKHKKNIGEGINTIIGKLAASNNLTDVIEEADFAKEDKLGKGQELIDRVSDLISIFENPNLDFSKNKAGGDDLLGDAYEYLMRNFATESGKSKGQFYTPSEVSRIIAKIIGISSAKTSNTTLYDPACGSGSLLLKAADEAPVPISIYGQEKEVATAGLAKMNMILHDNPLFEIEKGQSTLSNPLFLDDATGKLKTFDFVVANPPFSYKSWSLGVKTESKEADIYGRFVKYGLPPKKNGDYAFLLHIIKSLKSNGKGACILPHGVLFRGNAEAEIRKNIIAKKFIKGIIGLPPNLFYGTGIPACIIIIDKENTTESKGIFMIDAGKGFIKDGNKNRLREQDIHRIVDVFNKQITVKKYSRLVSYDEIELNDYNLNLPRYIDSQEIEDIQDIEAHLLGDIPEKDINDLEDYWTVYPKLKTELFGKSKRKDYVQLKLDKDQVKNYIFNHAEFLSFSNDVDTAFSKWRTKNTAYLKSIKIGLKPKDVIYIISEDILRTFCNKDLLDSYDVYQHLMDYWSETMQDDCYIISVDGWKAEIVFDVNKKEYECELIPKYLVIDRYFEIDKKAIETLKAERDSITLKLEEMTERTNEDGELIFEDAKNEKDKITISSIKERLKEIRNDVEAEEEKKALEEYINLNENQSTINKKIKTTELELYKKVIVKYSTFTEAEIKQLVVDDKWMKVIEKKVKSEMERISRRLTQRINELAERYKLTLSEINNEIISIEKKVIAHLKQMDFKWI